MSAIPIFILAAAAALFTVGAGAAFVGQRNVDPELAYIGALFIFIAFILAGLVGAAWFVGSLIS